jgi:hypothetical protein
MGPLQRRLPVTIRLRAQTLRRRRHWLTRRRTPRSAGCLSPALEEIENLSCG